MKNDQKVAALEAKIIDIESQNTELQQKLDWLMQQFRLAKHQQFCPSSEQTSQDQLSLFNEAEQENDAAPEPEIKEIKSYCRRKAGSVGLDRFPEDLPVEEIIIELPEEEQICTCCGEKMHVLGHEEREELKIVPANAVRKVYRTCTYGCRHCENHSDHVPILKAPMPAPVIKGSFASPEAVAHIACEKFVMGSPLYRQEQDWARKGIELSRQTMANWLIRATKDWLAPVYERLKTKLLENDVLHGDETTLQVLHEDGKTAKSKSYMWVYRTSGCAKQQIALFEYQPDRKAVHPAEFLDKFQGYLHTDGYAGYHNLNSKITVVGCWAHARRKFFDIIKTMPKEKRAGSEAARGVAFCDRLFALEEEFSELPPDENYRARYEARLRKSKPVLDDFYAWCRNLDLLPRSSLGRAVAYAQDQRHWLEHFLLDGRLEISNNRAENAIRPFAVGRKNWLFANTVSGAKTSAMLFSIIETAKANGINPFDYLTHIFKTAPNSDFRNNFATLDTLLPLAPLYQM
jgi:transposase